MAIPISTQFFLGNENYLRRGSQKPFFPREESICTMYRILFYNMAIKERFSEQLTISSLCFIENVFHNTSQTVYSSCVSRLFHFTLSCQHFLKQVSTFDGVSAPVTQPPTKTIQVPTDERSNKIKTLLIIKLSIPRDI